MSGLTPKGEFALELIRQGQHPTLNEIDRLWEQMQENMPEVVVNVCPTCKGTGVLA